MTSPRDGGSRLVSRLAMGLAVLAVLGSIGGPLLGIGVFAGTDLLEGYAPWDEVPPDGQVSNPLVSDLVDSSLPDRHQAVSRIHDGDLPMWQPFANGGRPLLALPNLGLLSPLNLPYLVLPLHYAPAVVQLLTLLVSLAGGLAWLRRLKTGWVPATVGALAYTFSGFAVVYAGFPAGHVAALLPVGLWAVDRAVDRRTWTSAVPIALVVASMWFEGFPQVTAFALLAMGAWAVAAAADGGPADTATRATRPGRAWVLGLAVPLAGVVLGTMLASVQLVPFLEDTARLDLSTRQQAVDDHLPLGTAVTVLAPGALGSTTDGTWFGPLNQVEVASSIAVTALVLAAVGLAVTPRRRRWRTAVMTAMAVVAGVLTWVGGPLLALAQTTPLFGLADVHRVRLLAVVGVVMLAAQGLDRVLRGPGPTRREIGVLAAVVAVGLVAVAVVTRAARELAPSPAQVEVVDRAVLLASAVGLLALVVALAGWVRPRLAPAAGLSLVALTVAVVLPLPRQFWPRTDEVFFYPSTPAHEFLEANLGHQRLLTDGLVMLPGTTTWYGLRTAAAHAFPTPEWRDMLEAVDPAVYERLSPTFPAVDLAPEVADSPILDRLAVAYLVTDPDLPTWDEAGPHADAYDLVHTASATIYERPSALPRIRWARDAEVIADAAARVARLADESLPDDTVVLSRPPPAGTSLQHRGEARVEVVRDAGDTIEVEVTTTAPGWLVVADTLEDWSATLDGAPTEIVDADHAGGAVLVPAGTHRVRLSYTPAGLALGAVIAAVAAVLLLALAVTAGRRRRRS